MIGSPHVPREPHGIIGSSRVPWEPHGFNGSPRIPREPHSIIGSPRVPREPLSPPSVSLRERLRQRQARLSRLYAALRELWEERRGRLQEQQRLWQLRRELDDVEQWLLERELVAASHEMGQDYEHVTVRRCPIATLPHAVP